jgi:cysteine desulfurase family protein (TIGR01976 family)
MTHLFDPVDLRQHFPSLKQQVNGRPAAFLDGPGGTQTPHSVNEAMEQYLRHDNSNQGGAFATSERTDQVVTAARQAMADFFNARRPEEIVFGQNMSSLTFSVSRAISRGWRQGDEIIVTRLDHDANISPWLMAAAERDVTVRWLDFRPEDCTLDLDSLPDLLNERTRLLAVTHASNAVGSLVDVARCVDMAHQARALVYVDAVHYSPHGSVDVQALDCDFLAASAYKFFGPHTGILYGKYELLDEMEAYKVRAAPDAPPGKWETGTQSFESLAGVTAAVDYLAGIGRGIGRRYGLPPAEQQPAASGRRLFLEQAMGVIKDHEERMSLHFLEQARTVPGLRVFGITDVERLGERAPTFAVSLAGYSARQVAAHLGRQGIFVWDGHYYAVAVMERLGVLEGGGLVRIGLVHYNTREEVDRTAAALRQLAAE